MVLHFRRRYEAAAAMVNYLKRIIDAAVRHDFQGYEAAVVLGVAAMMRKYFIQAINEVAQHDSRGETPVIRHLSQFYGTLLCVSMSSALGSYLCFTNIFGNLSAALLAYLMFRGFRRADPLRQNIRVCLLVCCLFFIWASLTPWFTWLLGVDKGDVVIKMLAASEVFGCFWLVSKLQQYGWGFVYSQAAHFSMFLLSFSLEFDTLRADQFWIVKTRWVLVCNVGLMHLRWFSKQVLSRAREGDHDHVEHAFNFCTDILSLVVLLLRSFRR